MFLLSNESFDHDAMKNSLRDSRSGGYVEFEGWVRDHNEGKTVRRLEYEAYDVLARSEGLKILDEARRRFAVNRLACVHRTGLLELGEVAVWVGVSAAHRDEAFVAGR